MVQRLVVENIHDLVTMAPLAKEYRTTRIKGADLGRVADAWMAIEKGRVKEYGTSGVPSAYADWRRVDAKGGLVLPGFVDIHTHPLFGGSRANEFSMRCAGATYQEVAAAGGGIASTVRATRQASDEELTRLVESRLRRFLRFGTTTLEVKTGYGLSTPEELRHLRVYQQVKRKAAQRLSITCLALHAKSPELDTPRAWADEATQDLLPRVAEERLADAVDAFVEDGYFSGQDIEGYLSKAKELGLAIRLHVDEFTDQGGGTLAARWGAKSADHLECTTPEGARAMAHAGVTAVILPGTSIYAKLPFAKGRMFADAGCPVAIASDFNPGSCRLLNLASSATVGSLHCGLSPAEALAAITFVPAASLEFAQEKGALAVGFDADFLIYRMSPSESTFEEWFAEMGQKLPDEVFIGGVRKFQSNAIS
jgi:imidazolonepropionase